MIRLTLLILFVLFLWVYAFRDWMVSLCGLILLTFLLSKKGGMLTPIDGILGLNLWNITLAVVTLAWLQRRQEDRRPWKLSGLSVGIVGGYIGIIVLGYVQAMLDMDAFPPHLQRDLWQFLTVDHLINPLKFIWVALLLADGCNSRRRLMMALGAVVGLGVLYAINVVKIIPLEALQSGDGVHYRWRIGKEIGLMANDMAKVLALTFWSILAIQRLWWRAWWSKIGVLAAYSVTFLGLAMCFSRAGYLSFVAVGFVLGCVRWRKLLWLGPPALLLLVVLMPTVTERMSDGFDPDPEANTDWNEVTAGRTGELWPPIIEEIWNAPFFGQGRLAIVHTPAYDKILALGGVPLTPHNGYLEVLVDYGALGLLIVLAAFVGAGVLSYRLVRQNREPLLVALGGVGLVHVTGCLVNAMSGGLLTPSQGMLGTLCVLGIVLRVWSSRVGLAKRTVRASQDAWWYRPAAADQHLTEPCRLQPYLRGNEPPGRMS